MGKSEKLYKESPSLKRDEKSGAVGVHKPTEADGEDMGVSGDGLNGAGHGMPIAARQAEMHKRHMDEMKQMHGRHEDEHSDMHKRHQKEVKSYGTESEQNITGGSGPSSTDTGAAGV